MSRLNWTTASVVVVDVGVLSCEAWVPIDIGAVRVAHTDGKPMATRLGARMSPEDPLDTVLWNNPELTGYTTEEINAFPSLDAQLHSAIRRRLGTLFADADAVVVYKEEYARQALATLQLTIPEQTIVVDMLPWMYFFRSAACAGWLQLEAHAKALNLKPTFSEGSPNRSARHVDFTWQLFDHYKSHFPQNIEAFQEQQRVLARTLDDWIAKLKDARNG